MRLLLNVLFFFQSFLFLAFVLSRNLNKAMGFEQSQNQQIDKFLLGILITYIINILSFKYF